MSLVRNDFVIVLFLSLILIASPMTTVSFAQQPPDKIPNEKNDSKTIQNKNKLIIAAEKKDSQAKKIKDKHDRLIDKAKKNGQVRVIVELDADFKSQLSKQEKAIQKQNIKSAQNSLMNSLSSNGIISSKNIENIPFAVMTVNPTVLDELMSSGLVKTIFEDKLNKISLDDTIPIVGADDLHNSDPSINGTGTVVAILDTGVEKTHDFFSGSTRVVAEACFSDKGTFSPGCPNGLDTQIGSGSAVPCSHVDCDHGTHVAGIAAGDDLTDPNFSGVAKGADIVAIQVFTVFTGGPNCTSNPPCLGAFDSDIILGLQHVLDLQDGTLNTLNIVSANLSLGKGLFGAPCDGEPHKSIIDALRAANIATIVSSGNDFAGNAISSPACISSAVSVSSTDKFGAVPNYANEDDFLDLFAPGGATNGQINSSVPGNTFGNKFGTSMAAPHVTGAWALLREEHSTRSVVELLTVLQFTGTPTPLFIGGTKSLIQIDAALSELDDPKVFCNRDISDFNLITGLIIGTSGDDVLVGTVNDDLIIGLEGNDSLKGNAGNDCLIGGDDADRLSGGAGDDDLQGGDGDDSLKGGPGADDLQGGDGADRLSGGDDCMTCDASDDGNDDLQGGAGDDSLKGGPGADNLQGGDGEDILSGGPDNDDLDGGSGDDVVLGRDGADDLVGGPGNDICVGGFGTDTIDSTCEVEI